MSVLRAAVAATIGFFWRGRLLLTILFPLYLLLVRYLRYQRSQAIRSPFSNGKRPLSSMTTEEAYDIMTQLQELEFPYAFNKARIVALLKAGGIPTMTKLFAVTGQNNRRNAGKRVIDTEILLREVQSQNRDSNRYMQAVARMNFLHSRYRKAGKILDEDLLHTLGSGLVEIFRVVDNDEWRPLTDVEKCAVGIFHKNLGDDMGIPYSSMLTSKTGWQDGLQFGEELRAWTVRYEDAVARPVATNDQYVRVYVDSATSALPPAATMLLRKVVGFELNDTMRVSLNLEPAGRLLQNALNAITHTRKFYLRHLALPRLSIFAVKAVDKTPNPISGLYNFSHASTRPWYVKPTFWNRWGPASLLLRVFGGKAPGTGGEKYHPKGYDLQTIGPTPQEGRGFEEMRDTVELLKGRGLERCPFST